MPSAPCFFSADFTGFFLTALTSALPLELPSSRFADADPISEGLALRSFPTSSSFFPSLWTKTFPVSLSCFSSDDARDPRPPAKALVHNREGWWQAHVPNPSCGRFANAFEARLHRRMARRFLTIMTGHNLPKIQQPREVEPSIINERPIADFKRVVEQTGILKRG